MQYAICLLFLATLSFGDLVVDPMRQKVRCPGGYEEGAEAVLGRYYYKCRDGELDPKGCISDQGNRVPLDGTTDSKNQAYRLQCVLDRQGFLTFEYKSCLYNGVEHGVNERWQDEKYIYACLREGDHLNMVVDGCMDAGREVSINEKVRRDNFVYQCKQTVNGTCSMCPVGCVKSNIEHLIGDTFEDGRFWFTCSNADGRVAIKPDGCVSEGQRLKEGDHFFRDDLTYECQVNQHDIVEKVSGCATRDDRGKWVERRFNDAFPDGQFDIICKYDQQTNKVTKTKVRCNYKVANGNIAVEPGCYRITEGSAIGCLKDPVTGELKVKNYRVDEIGTATSEGLRFC